MLAARGEVGVPGDDDVGLASAGQVDRPGLKAASGGVDCRRAAPCIEPLGEAVNGPEPRASQAGAEQLPSPYGKPGTCTLQSPSIWQRGMRLKSGLAALSW